MKRILTFSLVIILFGCSNYTTVTDSHTSAEIKTIKAEENMIIYKHNSDNMDRGNHNYYGGLVIDIDFYNLKEVQRGDVIYYEQPESYNKFMNQDNSPTNEFSISRIIGLPNEQIEIKSSQIFIDGKKLDTFYGKEHWKGVNLDGYKKALKEGNDAEHIVQFIDSMVNRNVEKLSVPKGYVYILGDTWGRSIDSISIGAIPIENIKGKVLGYSH
ncbi:signal peptidase I [Sutcliffiella rhizosphaerae]|uniref:Signal peptidase I n=1 Tax=Sutcliffiella rhizosphaerae TaxID=2880967 RepID=A0ABM8YUC2_9BACI|nr:signal peptidase I [Sutcliffiella rhizosphaerae]CAG9623588.1 hypothetical protein BACCIP111883_04406 [Sutcliffiella rhizosphaerae]